MKQIYDHEVVVQLVGSAFGHSVFGSITHAFKNLYYIIALIHEYCIPLR